MKIFYLPIVLIVTLAACDKNTETPLPINTSKVEDSYQVAPLMKYEPLYVERTGYSIGYSNDLFSVVIQEYGSALQYQSRAGVVNVLEGVVEDPESTGYVVIEKAYRFGDKYLIIISTGENGNSCPATTYAFTFDTKIESVTGKKIIDGCSEILESFSDGNKLIVKKDGETSVFYNGEVTG
ncbi:hypothetical protein ACE02D_10760 [Shewanella bicestrii]